MPKLIDYVCECGEEHEELFKDTEEVPEVLESPKCKCGLSFKKGFNIKKNCQNWRWNDFNGM